MVKRLYNIFGKSKASIGQNSNHNTIVQNSEINNPIICSNNVEVIRTLGNIKAYDVIQQQMQDLMSVVKKSHPLYPVFSAKYDNQLDSLVSTPETADAFKRYPKKVQSEWTILSTRKWIEQRHHGNMHTERKQPWSWKRRHIRNT